MLAGEVMDRSATLCNDRARTIYTYTAQTPYLNTAIDELLESMEENNIAVTNEVSAVLPLTALATLLTGLPTDIVEIRAIYERDAGIEGWIPVKKSEFLPLNLRQTNNLSFWTYQDNEIRFIGALGDKEILIEYIARIQVPIVDETTVISILNSKSFLAYRNAALCAEFIGENPSRAESLNAYASLALDRMLGIGVKSNQSVTTRRRPFMASYKARR
jgi:hypothetical protein